MRLSLGRLLRIFFQSLFIQTSWSFPSMQGMGFLSDVLVGVGEDKRAEIMKTQKGLFNTHPYMVSYIVGATVRAYDEGKASAEEIKRFLSVAQASFASAGDLLFWRTLRPALLLAAVILGVHYGIIGPLTFLVVYNIFHLFHRIKGISDGYNLGWDVIYLLDKRRFKTVRQVFEAVGAVLSGLLFSLIAVEVSYLLVIPLTALFLIMLIKRYSAVMIILSVLLVVLIIGMV
ncbi:MAG: PTS system mannose/fructose/sorbose family transporter subunit IID [candidate division WOR-3 bacterium]|nr:MAG: PTS system mannose/fructose/sorbose family transporter subunit IID [candidate division WOR-3 bacterium]